MFMARFQSEKLKQEVVLRDPVHGYIHIEDKVIFDIVKSKEFQRMRRIKQLGPVSYVFPGERTPDLNITWAFMN